MSKPIHSTSHLQPATCDPQDVALKCFFLGPQAENAVWVKDLLEQIFDRWVAWRRGVFPSDGEAISQADQQSPEFVHRCSDFADRLAKLMTSFEAEVPKFSPRYIGHMFSEISLPALLGHIVALLHNPNNISGESSRVGVLIEDWAIAALATMLGYSSPLGGHFTSGGTIANFESLIRARARLALWLARAAVARQSGRGPASLFEAAHLGWDAYDALKAAMPDDEATQAALAHHNVLEDNPFLAASRLSKIYGAEYRGPVVLIPEHKHYSWRKGVSLLGLGDEAFWPIGLDSEGRLDVDDLRAKVAAAEAQDRPIAMIVSVAGTTELGHFDPVDRVQSFLDGLAKDRGLHIWHHVDAAYGGFFASIGADDPEIRGTAMVRALAAIGRTDSVTLDPHKLGYVPYSSGVILVRSPRDYTVRPHEAPYILFSGSDRGPYTLEGSRPATGAAATWMTASTIGLDSGGYGRILVRTVKIRKRLEALLLASGLPVRVAPGSEANVLCFTVAQTNESLTVTNARAEALFAALSPEQRGRFIVSKTSLFETAYGPYLRKFVMTWNAEMDSDRLILLRLCMLNPFFDAKEMHTRFSDEFVACLGRLIATVGRLPAPATDGRSAPVVSE
jgi:glutamate/tyrosine decarboxylase-like PLP-dependent enzyme